MTILQGNLLDWMDHIRRDVAEHGGHTVITAMADTAMAMEERDYSKQAQAAMRWRKKPFWALPDPLMLDATAVRLRDGFYWRAWICVLDGVDVDGHVYVNQGSGCCQICGH